MSKLIAKILISGQIEAKTGLHIGGSKSSLDIGGVDMNVIKTPQGVPFIPGSSLKGKLRSLLAKTYGSKGVTRKDYIRDSKQKDDNIVVDDDIESIYKIFGSPNKQGYTRIIVRDALLNKEHFKNEFKDAEMELEYSDVKVENRINRLEGTARDPRYLERVPTGAIFDFEMVYDVYDDELEDEHLSQIKIAMHLLQNDFIGGHGSRGSGQIKFNEVSLIRKTIENYEKGEEGTKLNNFSF